MQCMNWPTESIVYDQTGKTYYYFLTVFLGAENSDLKLPATMQVCVTSVTKARPTADNCGWCQEGHPAVKTMPNLYNDDVTSLDVARAYPVSDARRPRLTSVRNGQGIPGFGRSRLKKLVRVRVGTLNVGSMTGRGRELADLMERSMVGVYQGCRRPGGRGTRRGS